MAFLDGLIKATRQRRHRLWLLAELSHLRHEDEPYAR
jgi:hypothetical protein